MRDHAARAPLPGLLLVLAFGAVLRLWGIGFGLPHTLTRPDEDATVSIAVGFVTRSFNPHFFDWPTLFMYVVAAAFAMYFQIGRLLGWFADLPAFLAAVSEQAAPLFRIARVVGAATGVLTIATVHAIGAELFDAPTALVAAFLLACTALHVRDSHFGVTDIAATWLVTMAFLFAVRWARRGRRRDAVYAAIWSGLAASTKYNAGLIVLPVVWAILASRDARRWWLCGACLVVAAAAFVSGTPYAVLDRPAFIAALNSISAHLRFGHAAMAGPGWIVHLTSSLRYGMGWPLLIASLAGLLLYLRRDRRAGLLFALFPVTYYAFIGGGQTAFARYIIPIIPFLCLAAAHLVVETGKAIATALGRRRWAPAFVWSIAIAIAGPSALSTIRSDLRLARTDNRLIAAEWIHAQYPNGTTMAQTGTVAGQVQMQTADQANAARYRQVELDRATGALPAGAANRTTMPELIVVEECPLPYCSVSDTMRRALARDYELRRSFIAVDATRPGLAYDRDDDFYLPLAGFDAVDRPGPNISVYAKRIDVRP